MIVKPITFPNHQPLNRTLAAQVVQTASRFDARVMIRRHQKVVNAKSMLGLLSLDADEQNEMFLVCDGADEEAASAAVLPFFEAEFTFSILTSRTKRGQAEGAILRPVLFFGNPRGAAREFLP